MALTRVSELAALLKVPEATVTAWAADLEVIAAQCLSTLTPEKYQLALFYLTGFFIQLSQREIASENVGSSGRSFSPTARDMASNPYGRMALQIAPCLATLSGAKQYTARLLA